MKPSQWKPPNWFIKKLKAIPQQIRTLLILFVILMECHNPHTPTLPHSPGECSACHSQIAQTLEESHHQIMSCINCHDITEQHKINPKEFIPALPQRRELCGTCHAKGAETEIDAPRVDMVAHGGNYVCWQCHYPHFPEVKQ